MAFETAEEVAQIKLIRMAASSTTLQNGRTADVTLAAIKTGNINKYLETNEIERPWAVVQQTDQSQSIPIGGGDQEVWVSNGTLWLYLARDVPAELLGDTQEIETEMARWFGKVRDEILALSGQEDPWLGTTSVNDVYSFCHIRDIRRRGFGEPHPKYRPTLGHFYFCGYEIDWGNEA